MSYYISKAGMRDDRNARYNCDWELGTLRVLYLDERDCWGITEPNDDWYGNALGWEGGEIFDGSAWRPLGEWWPVIEYQRVTAVERRADGVPAAPKWCPSAGVVGIEQDVCPTCDGLGVVAAGVLAADPPNAVLGRDGVVRVEAPTAGVGGKAK